MAEFTWVSIENLSSARSKRSKNLSLNGRKPAPFTKSVKGAAPEAISGDARLPFKSLQILNVGQGLGKADDSHP
jgi:hypothetical protein